MRSVSQTTDPRQIIGPPFITCVDLDGHQTPVTELWSGPSEGIDPTDPAAWPAWTDNWYWETDAADVAALEAEERERLADLCDAPDAAWHRMMAESIPAISGGAPFEPSPEDWEDYRRAFDEIDRRQVSDVELAMMAAGLAVG
jgi:hypothetical protein